jgi:peptidoglycan/LPS O-acetylase OafA/YrhL
MLELRGNESDTALVVADPPEPTPPASTLRSHPRTARVAALDGLRGIAVLAVVVYHLAPDRLPGGFLGVSMFFVLSGYLITSLLLSESTATGRIGLRRFWARRFRRLLPAALVGLALAVAVAALVGDPHQLRTLPGDIASAAAYVANWHFISQGVAYGAHYQQPSVVQHYWSLAIEEQFYIVVAVLAFALARTAARRRTWGLVFGGLALASMAATVTLGRADQVAVYFGTGTRAFELLAGALLAIALHRRSGSGPGTIRAGRRTRRLVQAAGALALAGLVAAFALVDIDDEVVYRGGLWVVAGLTVAVLVASGTTGPLSRALSWRPLTVLGLVSYGVYVFHWPLFILISPETVSGPAWLVPVARIAATALLTVGSYVLLEQPVRLQRWSLPPVRVAAVLSVSFVAIIGAGVAVGRQSDDRAVVAAPDIDLRTPTTSAGDADPGDTDVVVDAGVDPDRIRQSVIESVNATTSTDAPASGGVSADEPSSRPQKVVVMGDSMMQDAFPAMRAGFEAQGVTAFSVGAPAQTIMTGNGEWLADLHRLVQTEDPDVVVLESCCGDQQPFTLPNGWVVSSDEPAFWVAWDVLSHIATDIASSRGARVMWVIPPPADGVKSRWYGDIKERMEKVAAIERKIVRERPEVQLVDWSVMSAPDGSYSATLPDRSGDLVTVRAADGVHFSPAGQALQAQTTIEQVLANWVAGPGRPRRSN